MSGVHYTTELMSGAKSRKWVHQKPTNQPFTQACGRSLIRLVFY